MDSAPTPSPRLQEQRPSADPRPWPRALGHNRLALSGLILFLLFFLGALVGLGLTSGADPVLDPARVRLQDTLRPPLSRPNVEALDPDALPRLGFYLFGTDELGRDLFARMLQGAWVSLSVGFVAVGISVMVGLILGGLSGYYGPVRIRTGYLAAALAAAAGTVLLLLGRPASGVAAWVCALLLWAGSRGPSVAAQSVPLWQRPLAVEVLAVDTLIMRAVDIMLCFPSFFLILTVVALLPASLFNIMAVIGLTSWMGTARFVRAEFLSLREQDFVTAARALGIPDRHIIFRHIMPNAVSPVLVSATIGIATAILTEAGLSFLGFGVPPPHATWGNILAGGKNFIFDAPWLTFIPGIAILSVVLAFNLFGEGLRDMLNPRLRQTL